MFEGARFWVGLAVTPLRALSWPDPEVVPVGMDRHPTRLGELMPPAARDDVGLGEEVRRTNIADSRLWAYRVEMVAQLAARRLDTLDRLPGTPGAAAAGWSAPSWVLEGYSEFLPDEVALLMNCSRTEASRLIEAALLLVHWLPDTWAGLADGELSWSRARAISQEIARHLPELEADARAAVEVSQAPELAVRQLRALVRTELIKRDPEAADRRRMQAQAAADVRLRRSVQEGTAEVVTVVPRPVVAAILGTVDGHARQAKADGDARPIGLLRAEVMTHLTLRRARTASRRSPPSCGCSPR